MKEEKIQIKKIVQNIQKKKKLKRVEKYNRNFQKRIKEK